MYALRTQQNIWSQRVCLNCKKEWKEHKIWRQKNIKSGFYKSKKLTSIDDVDANEILVSKKEPYDTKNALIYFIGHNDNDVTRPLCVRLPPMTGYAKKFIENATMSFRANSKELLKTYNKMWEKTEKLLKIDLESKSVYGDDDKYIKSKIKICAGSMIANFHDKKMPKEQALCKFLSIIMLYSVIKANKKYYPWTFLEECKYAQENIKTGNHIGDDLEKSDSDTDRNDETESDIDNKEYI